MRRALQLALCGICVICGFASGLRAQDVLTLPMERTRAGWLVTVEINGKPVLLQLDTGATDTHLDAGYLNSRREFAREKLRRSDRAQRTVTGAGESRLAILDPVRVAIAGRAFHLEALDIDLAAQRKHCACAVAGILGLNVLTRFSSITFDFRARELRLVKNATTDEHR